MTAPIALFMQDVWSVVQRNVDSIDKVHLSCEVANIAERISREINSYFIVNSRITEQNEEGERKFSVSIDNADLQKIIEKLNIVGKKIVFESGKDFSFDYRYVYNLYIECFGEAEFLRLQNDALRDRLHNLEQRLRYRRFVIIQAMDNGLNQEITRLRELVNGYEQLIRNQMTLKTICDVRVPDFTISSDCSTEEVEREICSLK